MNFTLTQEQYEALVAFARKGAENEGQKAVTSLEAWLRLIEAANNITRSFVMVQWEDPDKALPPGTEFPEKWPPELRDSIELVTRPVARADVDELLASKAGTPMQVLCTRDPAGIVGWTAIDDFFTN